jgi:hypothetical protein
MPVRSSPYRLVAVLNSPDQVLMELWKGGRFDKAVGVVDAADLSDAQVDNMGRVKPEAVWSALEGMKSAVESDKGVTVRLPEKSEIMGGSY